MNKKLEAACFSVHSALVAIESGVDRIEFCADYNAGGVTPSLSDFKNVKEKAGAIPVYVMIRPRSGNFHYHMEELLQMKSDIDRFGKAGADGFVFGVLTHEMAVNIPVCSLLAERAAGLPLTFHRAFDRCADATKAIEDIIACGFMSVLTSGKAANVAEGADLLTQLVSDYGHRIECIAGGGIRSTNLLPLCRQIPAPWFHSAAITGGTEADKEEWQKMIKILRQCET